MFGIFNKAKRDAERYKSGWNYAAGELLAGKTLDEMYDKAQYGVDFDGPNPFDRGISDACNAWRNRDYVLVNEGA